MKRKIYYACLCLYAVGIVLRITLDKYWHSVRYVHESLYIVPWVFLIVGMLVWASAWREWK